MKYLESVLAFLVIPFSLHLRNFQQGIIASINASNRTRRHAEIKNIVVLCFLSMLVAVSCAPMKSSVRQWMDAKRGAPGFDLTGRWDAGPITGGGWGGASFIQTGDGFLGTMGPYSVEGIVNGNDAYMMILSGGRVYYTAKVSLRTDGTVVGIAAEKSLVGTDKAAASTQYPLILRREGETEIHTDPGGSN